MLNIREGNGKAFPAAGNGFFSLNDSSLILELFLTKIPGLFITNQLSVLLLNLPSESVLSMTKEFTEDINLL